MRSVAGRLSLSRTDRRRLKRRGPRRAGLKKENPIERRKYSIFRHREQNEAQFRQNGAVECTGRAESERVAKRKNIGIGQPVGILAYGGAAVRAEIDSRRMFMEAAMTKRQSFVAFEPFFHVIAPWVSGTRSAEEPVQ